MPRKVLVFDDEPFILMIIRDKLVRAGLEVVTSRTCVGGLELCREHKPDLILLDWVMPEVSGVELCKALKADPELSSIPIIMVTARGQEADERLGLGLGASRFVKKPFSPRALLDVVLGELKGDV